MASWSDFGCSNVVMWSVMLKWLLLVGLGGLSPQDSRRILNTKHTCSRGVQKQPLMLKYYTSE